MYVNLCSTLCARTLCKFTFAVSNLLTEPVVLGQCGHSFHKVQSLFPLCKEIGNLFTPLALYTGLDKAGGFARQMSYVPPRYQYIRPGRLAMR